MFLGNGEQNQTNLESRHPVSHPVAILKIVYEKSEFIPEITIISETNKIKMIYPSWP